MLCVKTRFVSAASEVKKMIGKQTPDRSSGPSFAKAKFNSMLLTATLTMAAVAILLLSDTIIAGNFVGSTAVMGITAVVPLYSAANFVAGLIGMGTSYLYSEAMGRFDKERADRLFGQAVILSVASGLLMFLLMLSCENLYFAFLELSPEIELQARAYYFWVSWLVLITPINFLLSEMVYCDGDELISNISTVITLVGNIALSILLCMKLGSAGISLASFICTALGTVISLAHFLREKNSLHFVWHLNGRDIVAISKKSIVDSVFYLCLALLGVFCNSFVLKHFGSEKLIIASMIINVIEMTLIFDGIGEALSPLLNVYVGERNTPDAREVSAHGCFVAFVEGCLMCALSFFAAPLLAKMYGLDNPAELTLAVRTIRQMSLFMPMISLEFFFSSEYLVIDKIALASAATVISFTASPMLIGSITGLAAGSDGFVTGVALSSLASVALMALFVRKKYGKELFPWLIEDVPGRTVNNWSLYLDDESVIELRDLLERELKAEGVDSSTSVKLMIIAEDSLMSVAEHNPGKRILAECTLAVADEYVEYITKDTGRVFDITDSDMKLASFRDYIVSSLACSVSDRRNLLTTGYNRSCFRIERQGEK